MKVVVRNTHTGLETSYEDYDIVVYVGDNDEALATSFDLADFVDAHYDLQRVEQEKEVAE